MLGALLQEAAKAASHLQSEEIGPYRNFMIID